VRQVLARRGARLFFGGQLVSMFGDWALVLVLGIWAKSLTGSSADAGLVFFTFAAAALLAPLGGWVADRVPRRPLMVATNCATGLVILSLLFVHGRRELWLLYVVTFLYGLGGDLFQAAQSALLRVLFPQELLGEANALLQSAMQGMRLVAPLAGAGLYAAVGGGWVAVLDAATFGVSAITLWRLDVEEPRPEPSGENLRTEFAAGLRHIVATRALRQIVIGVGVALLVVGFAETLVFVVLQRSLHRSPAFFGVLSAFQGAGSIAGALTAARMLRRTGDTRLTGLGVVVFGAGDFMLIVPHLGAVMAGAFVGGIGLTWAIVALGTALQLRTPLALQGRVSAAANLGLAVPQTISIATGAALSTVVDYRVLIVVMTVVTVASGLWLASRREPSRAAEPAPA
jgi:MFS transporter